LLFVSVSCQSSVAKSSSFPLTNYGQLTANY
jgi:hypothetical protein